MSNLKRPADIKELFDISHQTVRRWTEEFEQYLSSNATPPPGEMRTFTDDDLKVFALVADVKNRGGTYEDAHSQLRVGERGDIPEAPPSDQEKRVVISQLAVQNKELRVQIEAITNERDKAVGQLQSLREDIIRLQTKLEMAEERVSELKEEGRDDLLMEIGRLKALLEISRQKDSDVN